MSSAALTVLAALGAALLTGVASPGVMWLQEHLRAGRASRDALSAAVAELLSGSLAVSMRAQTAGNAMKVRSGLGEGIDVTFGWRKPLDPLEFHDWLAQDMNRLLNAWSHMWALADDQELIRRANALLSSCGAVVSVNAARMPAATVTARTRRAVVGERWTQQMQNEVDAAAKALAHAREQLAQRAGAAWWQDICRTVRSRVDRRPGVR